MFARLYDTGVYRIDVHYAHYENTAWTSEVNKLILTRTEYVCGTIIITLRNKTQKYTQLKFYKVLAVPTLLRYISDNGERNKRVRVSCLIT